MGIDPCKLVLNPEMHGQGKTGLHQDAGGGHGVQGPPAAELTAFRVALDVT